MPINIREAMRFHLEGLREDGEAIPPPRANFTCIDAEAA